MALKCLDVFTGIGGMTHGLRGIVEPIAYCEKDAYCVSVLETLMRTGRIPSAPVHDDVRTLDGRRFRGRVDVVMGGSPCVGFSSAGKRCGLNDAQSGLYRELVRIVDEANPAYVFFENVAAIARRGGAARVVVEDFERLGYACAWTTMHARDVGAPQFRRRWFMLATKRGDDRTNREIVVENVAKHDWTNEPCPRMAPIVKRVTRNKFRALGNAAVPDQVRAAFEWLIRPRVRPFSSRQTAHRLETELSFHGTRRDGETLRIQPFPSVKRDDADLVLDPNVVVESRDPKNTSPALTARVRIPVWGTPRSSFVNSNSVLTARSAKDLPTQLRFEIRTTDDTRNLHPNPDWIAWLQGFPAGWLDGDTHVISRVFPNERSVRVRTDDDSDR